jgi:HSP20 family molecular chaperone IbpA
LGASLISKKHRFDTRLAFRRACASDTSARKNYKEVKLPTSIKKDPAESKFGNGILEIKLVKAKHSGEKGA